ncbi:MAG: hypothetical protein JWN78_7 [Bacteroidota bacterium]|nr:hypothetical protein [Bacteroidota bacterium]
MRIHRSYTHALFTHPFMALPFAYLAFRLFKRKISFFTWYLFFLFGFFTHVMMDCCTTYGTQLLLPFTDKLISWNNLSVVDPLFTLPMIIFFIIVFFFKRENNFRRYTAGAAIALSLLYLTTSTINKINSAKVFRNDLLQKNIHVDAFSTTPTMFTSWLWNMVAYNDSTMYLGEYSVFQKSKDIDVISIPRHTALLNQVIHTKPVQTSLWFSQGNYFVEQGDHDTLDFFITKWGRADFSSREIKNMFPFYGEFYKDPNGNIVLKQVEPHFSGNDFKHYFAMLRKRIFYE